MNKLYSTVPFLLMFLPCGRMGCLPQFQHEFFLEDTFLQAANCSRVGPSYFLPKNLFMHGFLSMGYSFCQESALARDFHGLQLPSGHSLFLQGYPSQAARGPLLHNRSPWAAGESALVPFTGLSAYFFFHSFNSQLLYSALIFS